MRHTFFRVIIFCCIASLISTSSAITSTQIDWTTKVDPWLLDQSRSSEPIEFLVFLEEQADLSRAANIDTKAEKGEYVYITLRDLAEATQAPVIRSLEGAGAEFRSYWVANMLWVRADQEILRSLAERTDVDHIYANPKIHLEEPIDTPILRQTDSPEWNLIQVNAPQVWARGYTGQGVVVGGQDTGYEWDHPALKNQYRGWDGQFADHDYNWHDSIHSTIHDDCDSDSPEPCDDNSHGTHTMGTIVGDDGGLNQVGMAPGARWIGCRNMDEGVGTPATYTECYQWFIAPTRIDGSDPDPSKAPDVINNSWSCPTSEGCNPDSLRTVVQAVTAAGILTVHSAGNGSPSCESINTPAAIYPESFTVGATDFTDLIASFSLRGPVTIDGVEILKPEISAPGVSITSAVLNDGYGIKTGTSMAAPHVTGLIALLISAEPVLRDYPENIRSLIQDSAVPLMSSQDCGGFDGSQIPNTTFGWGRIDSLSAVDALEHYLEIEKEPSVLSTSPGGLITYTLTVTHNHFLLPTYDLIMTDTLPVDVEFVSATGDYDFDGELVRWTLSSLNPNETWSEQLTVHVPLTMPYGILTNDEYSVSSSHVPEVSGSPVSTVIHFLALEKTAPETVNIDDPVSYTLSVSNTSPIITATNVVLTDTVPSGTQLITATQPHTLDGQIITWGPRDLPPNEDWSVQMIVSATQTGSLVNADYGVRSAEVDESVPGEPVHTLVWSAGVEMNGKHVYYLLPGESELAVIELQNTGSLTDTFTLQINAPPGWANLISPGFITLPPGEISQIELLISVPNDAETFQTGIIEIDASSTNSPDESSVFPITVRVELVRIFPFLPNE